jgi:hypothetical protein
MVMLSIMSASYIDTAYDYHNYIIRRQRIDEAIKEARMHYSNRIIHIVKSILSDINTTTTFENLAQM